MIAMREAGFGSAVPCRLVKLSASVHPSEQSDDGGSVGGPGEAMCGYAQ